MHYVAATHTHIHTYTYTFTPHSSLLTHICRITCDIALMCNRTRLNITRLLSLHTPFVRSTNECPLLLDVTLKLHVRHAEFVLISRPLRSVERWRGYAWFGFCLYSYPNQHPISSIVAKNRIWMNDMCVHVVISLRMEPFLFLSTFGEN